MFDPMRIDAASLIAAQSVQRPAPAALRGPQAADKPLFEPLNFPTAEAGPSPAKSPANTQQTAVRRLGSQLDITV
jgi:hypothetical protein